jgi:cytochrome c oxidase subunit 1
MVLLILGIFTGFLQVLYRAGVIHAQSVHGINYYQGLTLHGTINAIVFTTFFAVAFGQAVIRFHLGKPLVSAAAWLACILMTVGTIAAAIPMLLNKASVLYTFYPPLKAHPAFYIGLVLVVVGSWIAFFSWIPTYRAWKRENVGKKTPLAVTGTFATSSAASPASSTPRTTSTRSCTTRRGYRRTFIRPSQVRCFSHFSEAVCCW